MDLHLHSYHHVWDTDHVLFLSTQHYRCRLHQSHQSDRLRDQRNGWIYCSSVHHREISQEKDYSGRACSFSKYVCCYGCSLNHQELRQRDHYEVGGDMRTND